MATFTTVAKTALHWAAPAFTADTSKFLEIGGNYLLEIGSGYKLIIQSGGARQNTPWTRVNKTR